MLNTNYSAPGIFPTFPHLIFTTLRKWAISSPLTDDKIETLKRLSNLLKVTQLVRGRPQVTWGLSHSKVVLSLGDKKR